MPVGDEKGRGGGWRMAGVSCRTIPEFATRNYNMFDARIHFKISITGGRGKRRIAGRRGSQTPMQEASAADASHDACALSPQNSDVRVGVRVDVALISAVVGLKHRDQSPYTGDPVVGFKDVCRCPSQIFARGRVANSLTGHAHPHDH